MKNLCPTFENLESLIPAIIQNYESHKVLMLGYMNEAAFKQTLHTKKVTFFSRSKNRLWVKGETSGNSLHYVNHKVDCDNDTLLVFVKPEGPTCHTLSESCFEANGQEPIFTLFELEKIIQQKIKSQDKQSYVSTLSKKGTDKVAQKVGEEATELVIEAIKNDNKNLLLNEAADLLFHYMVLLKNKNTSLSNIINILEQRHSKKTK